MAYVFNTHKQCGIHFRHSEECCNYIMLYFTVSVGTRLEQKVWLIYHLLSRAWLYWSECLVVFGQDLNSVIAASMISPQSGTVFLPDVITHFKTVLVIYLRLFLMPIKCRAQGRHWKHPRGIWYNIPAKNPDVNLLLCRLLAQKQCASCFLRHPQWRCLAFLVQFIVDALSMDLPWIPSLYFTTWQGFSNK